MIKFASIILLIIGAVFFYAAGSCSADQRNSGHAAGLVLGAILTALAWVLA